MAGSAAHAADSRQGQKLAERWCASCHYVDSRAQAPDAAPPFAPMADEAAYPDARLRGWLTDPHPPMPNLSLSRTDIDNIIAYIRTLND
jgi:cytochrome c